MVASTYSSNDDSSVEESVVSNEVTHSNEQSDGGFAVQIANKEKQKKTLARKETQAVSTVRVVIFLVLLLAALAVCLMVYFYSRADEIEDFEVEFQDYANKIIESYTTSIEQQLGVLDSLSVAITSYAKSTGAAFPKVLLPDFSLRSSGTRIQLDSTVFSFAPVVTDENRKQWETFAAENKGWLEEQTSVEMAFRKQQDQGFGVEPKYAEEVVTPYNDRIFHVTKNRSRVVEPEGTGPYLPIWLTSPVTMNLQNTLNMNLRTHPHFVKVMDRAMVTQKAIFNKVKYVYNSSSYSLYLVNGQYRYKIVEHAGDPTSNLIYPVFDDFGDKKSLAGWIFVNIYFNLYFSNILPQKARGIHCVLENSLNQTFTYRIDGSKVSFLGEGDFHENQYDDMALTQPINEYLQRHKAPDTASYTVSDLDDDYCSYKLHVYPSTETEEAFLSNEPLLGAIIVGCVFIITSLVFAVYDKLVERRQNVVMDRAAASGAIVSSLFPKHVEQRLMEETDAAKLHNKNKNTKDWLASNDTHKHNDDDNGKDWLSRDDEDKAIQEMRSKQIAELYPATTILFADLAGFTAWSSERTPQDVFVLLETVYKAFDKIADQRGVYKIETIGDCYVAVTGLPDPQVDHAVRMVKFANGCLNKMDYLTQRLKGTLGEDTAELQMRIGLHSGAVTAGVLRGQKSRFQLFGDTMNTASRMESNGVKGRIHVSQATVDELTAQGKSHWVTPREDKIIAKGKGEMQTYFVEINKDKSSRISAFSQTSTSISSIAKDINNS